MAEVHGQYSNELVLNNADVAELYEYIYNTPNLLTSSMEKLTTTGIPRDIRQRGQESVTYKFGDINIHGVQQPNEFVKALEMEMGNLIKQGGMRIK